MVTDAEAEFAEQLCDAACDVFDPTHGALMPGAAAVVLASSAPFIATAPPATRRRLIHVVLLQMTQLPELKEASASLWQHALASDSRVPPPAAACSNTRLAWDFMLLSSVKPACD